MTSRLQLFHYHLVTSKVRLEARYLGKLGFGLLGRYGWRGETSEWFEPARRGARFDRLRLRLVELAGSRERRPPARPLGAPARRPHRRDAGRGRLHRGARAGGRSASRFRTTRASGRSSPPRRGTGSRCIRPRLDRRARREERRAEAQSFTSARRTRRRRRSRSKSSGRPPDSDVLVGDTLVRFQGGGPEGRPELVAEVLL